MAEYKTGTIGAIALAILANQGCSSVEQLKVLYDQDQISLTESSNSEEGKYFFIDNSDSVSMMITDMNGNLQFDPEDSAFLGFPPSYELLYVQGSDLKGTTRENTIKRTLEDRMRKIMSLARANEYPTNIVLPPQTSRLYKGK